ncbi:TrbG/VirB9 family P-type conjugative transfer protein [Pseudomonas gingeri]
MPTSLLTDSRVKQVPFDPNQVYELVGTYNYQTSIEFEADEMVKVVALGDTIAWQTVTFQNRLFLKPVEDNAKTNLTVITSKRTYYFQLDSTKSQKGQAFLVRFIYPNNRVTTYAGAAKDGDQPTYSASPSQPNINYGFAGDKDSIGVTAAMDDGQFTRFLLKKGGDMPQVYMVMPDGTEALVNKRREGDYIVVERTASMFVLRDGNAHVCVENLANPYKRTVKRGARDGGGA